MGAPKLNVRSWTDKQLEDAYNSSRSVAQVLGKLKLSLAGGNYRTIELRAKELNLSLGAEAYGQAWSKGSRRQNKSLEDMLANPKAQSHYIKLRLIKDEILEAKCSKCGLTEWLGEPAPLELDHINGIHADNRLENLRILCPNCHAQTQTYSGKNRRKQALVV